MYDLSLNHRSMPSHSMSWNDVDRALYSILSGYSLAKRIVSLRQEPSFIDAKQTHTHTHGRNKEIKDKEKDRKKRHNAKNDIYRALTFKSQMQNKIIILAVAIINGKQLLLLFDRIKLYENRTKRK